MSLISTDEPAGRILRLGVENEQATNFRTTGGVGVLPVNRVLFVDGSNSPGATADGTLGAPYATIQTAVDRATAEAWDIVQIQIAPGAYADDVTITQFPLQYCILSGWCPSNRYISPTTITGTITSSAVAGNTVIIGLMNLDIDGPAITSDAVDHDVSLIVRNAVISAPISAYNVAVDFANSDCSGDITATNRLEEQWDDYSWFWRVFHNATITGGVDDVRAFHGSGQNEFLFNLSFDVLPIGSTAFQDVAVPDVRAGDYGILQIDDPSAVDFIAGFHSSSAGSVRIWLTNLSRNPGDFSDPARLLISHTGMAVQT